ncbi:MAG: ribbon-helix-helix domain-containing protein [Dehalococcoidales bacterium]
MTTQNKRITVYLDPVLHKALRIKAIDSDMSVSEIINDTIRQALLEDAEDLAAFEERKNEPDISFEELVKRLKLDGRI